MEPVSGLDALLPRGRPSASMSSVATGSRPRMWSGRVATVTAPGVWGFASIAPREFLGDHVPAPHMDAVQGAMMTVHWDVLGNLAIERSNVSLLDRKPFHRLCYP